MEGTFKWYNREKGYGFILGEDSKDYFVHHSGLPEDQQDIRETDTIKVTFDVKQTDRGTQAQNIVFVSGDAAAEESDSEEAAEEVSDSEEVKTEDEEL